MLWDSVYLDMTEIGAGVVLPIQGLSAGHGKSADTNGRFNGWSEMGTHTHSEAGEKSELVSAVSMHSSRKKSINSCLVPQH